MSRGGIIIQNRGGDGRGIMLPEREGSGNFNKLPFVSMACPKEEIGINPVPAKVIIKTRKVNQKVTKKKKDSEDKLYPLENYRKIKTSQQFWKKNENPMYKEYNKKDISEKKTEIKNINKNEDIKEKTLTNNITTPQKLPVIINKYSLPKKNLVDERKNDDTAYEQKPEKKEVKISEEINNEKIETEKNNEIKKENNEEDKTDENKENIKNEEIKDKKDPLLEEELDENENIDEILNYLNGLDYDKYCKDMEIKEALTILKNKMDKDLEEKNKNKKITEGEEQKEENKSEKNENDDDEKKKNLENENKNNKIILPEINKTLSEQKPVEIVNEEELKRKEEIKKYKIAEQIAKTEEMKAVHSVNSIKKLLQREGLDKLNEPAPLKITVIKESPLANCDGYEANKLPFLHSLPLV